MPQRRTWLSACFFMRRPLLSGPIIHGRTRFCCKTVWAIARRGDRPVFQHQDPVGVLQRLGVVGHIHHRLAAIRVRMLFQTQSLPAMSMAAVASSSSRMSDFCKSARATEKRCRCRQTGWPRLPPTVCHSLPAAPAQNPECPRPRRPDPVPGRPVVRSKPYSRFCRMVPEYITLSAVTYPTAWRKLCREIPAMSCPSTAMVPFASGYSRSIRFSSVVLPLPEGPRWR